MRRLLPLLLAAAAPAILSAAPGEDARFQAVASDFITGLERLHPATATYLGEHRHDAEVEDLSAAGRARDEAFLREELARLNGIDRARLTRDDQVDAALLGNELRYRLWQLDTLQDWRWDPQLANETISGGLYLLAARPFAPWPDRLRSATARMEQAPAMYAAMRASLDPARVPLIHAQTVAAQNAGAAQIAETMLAPHRGELPPADRARFDRALAMLKGAVAEQQHWLDTVLVPGAKGDFRLGPQRYAEAVRFTFLGETPGELQAKATAEAARTREQMYALAQAALAGKPGAPTLPQHPTAAQQQAGIEAALALTYAQRPARTALMDVAKADLATATEFVRAKELVALPTAPVQVITMPKFQQGTAVAYDDPPGPLETGGANFFAISPIPDDWSDAQATSFLSEYNDSMVQDLVVHEAMPGHYVQLFHANQDRSTLRALLRSGPFVEGWAVYAEGMMADEGYRGGDPLFKLTVLKMRLRSITNTLLDIGIQSEGMTREQAMELMSRGAFQQEREAAGKWVRATLGATQLLSYYSGYEQHMALREEARQRWGAGFTLRRYNDAVLAHGSPPTRFVRELMFDLPVG